MTYPDGYGTGTVIGQWVTTSGCPRARVGRIHPAPVLLGSSRGHHRAPEPGGGTPHQWRDLRRAPGHRGTPGHKLVRHLLRDLSDASDT